MGLHRWSPPYFVPGCDDPDAEQVFIILSVTAPKNVRNLESTRVVRYVATDGDEFYEAEPVYFPHVYGEVHFKTYYRLKYDVSLYYHPPFMVYGRKLDSGEVHYIKEMVAEWLDQ